MNKEYIPSPANVDCSKCEFNSCHSREKYQRDFTHFTYTSGRCPKLPYKGTGKPEPEWEHLYRKGEIDNG